MPLRLCFMLICVISGNSFCSIYACSNKTDTAEAKIKESCSAQPKTVEWNSLICADLFKPSSLQLNDSIFQSGEDRSFLNKTSNEKKWLKTAMIPAGLITAGLITAAVPENTLLSKYTIQKKITDKYPDFSTEADNYLQFVPGSGGVWFESNRIKKPQ